MSTEDYHHSLEHPQMKDPRAAGGVRRWHTWSISKDQSDAEHQWNVARLVFAVWPDARPELIKEALFHDTGERVAGDMPYPLKSAKPELKKPLDELERVARLNMVIPWGLPAPQILSDLENKVLKVCDLLEMLEWSLEELEKGNRNAELVRLRCRTTLDPLIGEIEVEEVRDRMSSYLSRRLWYHEQMMRGDV